MSDDTVDLGIEDLADAVEVGAGGFGTVYKARQASLHRDVAVKMVSNTVKDRKVRIRFEREIQAMGMLSGHPNIVTVYDSGFTGSGQPYILMDFMEQGSLADRLDDEGPLPWQDVLQIMVKVCGALETAHQAGVLHRDLKPENVLVSAYGEPKLGDFGIARLKGGPETGTSSLTASIEHVSPELLEAQQPSVASDLYALGSTMFKLLTGTAAFIRPGDESIVPALTRIRDEPVPDLRDRGVPPAVADVVERAMAKDPAARYATAVAMGRALREAQRSLGLAMTPMPVREEDAAAARESTRTLNSDEVAQSMEELGLGPSQRLTGGGTGPVGPPPTPAPTPPAPRQPIGQGPGVSQGYAVTGPAPAPPQTGYPQQPQQPQQGYASYPPQGSTTPWGKILAGVGVLVVLAGIGTAIALSGGDDPEPTPPPTDPTATPTATATPTPTPTATPTAYAAFEDVQDDTERLVVRIPRPWTDVDGSAWQIDGADVGLQIEASTDIEAFRGTWGTPGLILGSSEQLQASFDPDTLLDAVSFSDQCTYEGRQPYSDAAYTGFRDDYSGCGGTDTTYTVIAAEPATQARILLLQFQAVDERDTAALDQVIETFFDLADRPEGADGAAPSDPPPPPAPEPTAGQ
jgi:serine/threonine-protein kinase PknK